MSSFFKSTVDDCTEEEVKSTADAKAYTRVDASKDQGLKDRSWFYRLNPVCTETSNVVIQKSLDITKVVLAGVTLMLMILLAIMLSRSIARRRTPVAVQNAFREST